MATQSGTIDLNITGSYSNADAVFGATAKNYSKRVLQTLANGTAADQADLLYTGTGSVAAGGAELDLAGVLTDAFAGVLTMVKIVAILIRNANTPTNEKLIIGNAASPWLSWLGAGTHTVTLGPNGTLLLINPTDGYAVTAGTGDKLKLAAGGAYNTAYELMIWARSA